jgi:hypothetical protein
MRLVDSPVKMKKWRAIFENGRTTDFGHVAYEDYATDNLPESRKTAYLNRHRKRENWDDPYSAGALSRWILWNEPSLERSLKDFRRRFPGV